MPNGNFSNWINDGDKYAIVPLNVKTEGALLVDNVGQHVACQAVSLVLQEKYNIFNTDE